MHGGSHNSQPHNPIHTPQPKTNLSLQTISPTPTTLHHLTTLLFPTLHYHTRHIDSLASLYHQATQHNSKQTIQQHYNTLKAVRAKNQAYIIKHKITYLKAVHIPSIQLSIDIIKPP